MKPLADYLRSPKGIYSVWHCSALREFSCFISGVYRSLHFACLYFTNQSEAQMCPHTWHIVPIRVQSLARVSKYHSVPLYLSILLQAQSLSCCCHLLFTLLLWSYKNTILDGSCSCQGFSTFPFILRISLVLSLAQICKSGSEALISLWELVLDSSQFWRSSIAIIVVLDSRALAYLPESIHLLFHGSKNGVILNVD